MLGVHPNTIRNWTIDGQLEAVSLKGSRFRRYRRADVLALQAQQHRSNESLAEARSVVGPELVDAQQLIHWADRRESHAQLPELLRRLLIATDGVSEIAIRAGEGIAIPGWDGQAQSAGSTFLPRGELRFEIGAGRNPRGKAQSDYDKRAAALREEPAPFSFVFVTPRRWADGHDWAAARRAERRFADVRVIDVDDLEAWLSVSPAAHYWVSELLGRYPGDVETLDSWWDRFSTSTQPVLPADLFLAGRRNAVAGVEGALSEQGGEVVGVQSAAIDDATAFLAAAIEEMTGPFVKRPALVVYSMRAWNRLCSETRRMVLVPRFPDPAFSRARENGHIVLVPIGRNSGVQPDRALQLRPPDRDAAATALRGAGLPDDRAYRLAGLARRSLPALVRRLSRDPLLQRPEWIQSSASRALAPLALVGGWSDTPADWDLVAEVAGSPVDEIERSLLQWHLTEDAPFIRTNHRWQMASREEGLELFAPLLTERDLERFAVAIGRVLLEPDPRADLKGDERIMADVRGISRTYSSTLRRALADCLAAMGGMPDLDLPTGESAADFSRRCLRQLLGGNQPEGVWDWETLSAELPLLAEASPDDFLESLESDLASRHPRVVGLFQDTGQASGLFGGSPHTSLLWALETLAWAPAYLGPATAVLAKLATVDPGGSLANRPSASLASILVTWVRHTSAGLDERKQALAHICRAEDSVAWDLVQRLWPSLHATSSPPAEPVYRDWRPESRSISVAERFDLDEDLVAQAIGLAGSDPARWAVLAQRTAPLPPPLADEVVGRLRRVISESTPGSLDVLWAALRDEVAKHRRYPDADWALSDERVAVLEELANQAAPQQGYRRFVYLFDWFPDLEGVDRRDRPAFKTAAAAARADAIVQVWDESGLRGIGELAGASRWVRSVGFALADADLDLDEPALLSWLIDDSAELREVASSWVFERVRPDHTAELGRLLDIAGELDLPDLRLAVATAAPRNRHTWDVLDQVDKDLAAEYWASVRLGPIDLPDGRRAVERLLEMGRGWAAIETLVFLCSEDGHSQERWLPELVVRALDAALADQTADVSGQAAYEVGELLDYLAAGEKSDEVPRFEFAFFPILEHVRTANALYEALGQEADHFVDFVALAFRGKNEERRTLSGPEQDQARQAQRILHNWRRAPGQDDDGLVNREQLEKWVTDARAMLAERNRADIGDELIGEILGRTLPGEGGEWPQDAVADVVEAVASASLETGLHIGRLNSRGVTTRGAYDGGSQERELAAQYRAWAATRATTHRRTARVLRDLAEEYGRDAKREDNEAAMRADFD